MEKDKPVTLDECAQYVCELNEDLKHNTEAYRYFTRIIGTINKVVEGNHLEPDERLPTLPFAFDTAVIDGKYMLRLSEMDEDDLITMVPTFMTLLGAVGEDLLRTWDRLIAVIEEAKLLVANARSS